MRVAALYRYPVKGFTRESRESLDVLPGGRIAGDRVLGLRFHDAAVADEAWGTKLGFVALVHTPALAALGVTYEASSRRLRLRHGDTLVLDVVLDDDGRRRFAAAIERYLADLGDPAVAGRPERLPLRLVGDGVTPRYQDREPGYVTLHGRGSLDALAGAIGEAPALAEQRFRSNVAVDGVGPWDEQRWVGHRLRIGAVDFEVANPVTRCLATHANPASGTRDAPVMPTLLGLYRSERPTFAVMMTSASGGTIRVGDRVEPIAR
jgi:uncharacterized protein YcbX